MGEAIRAGTGVRTIALCFTAALLEGADIVSMGLAAPKVARQFHFGPGQMSYILTAAIVGLMLGAAIGGGLGDRQGRKRVLLGSFVLLAVFSLATVLANDLTSFVAIRFLAGLGLGAAFPNLIALAAEASNPGRRATAVGLMFAGQPVGGSCLGLITAAALGPGDWHSIFLLGGGLPIVLLPLLALFLPESSAFRAAAGKRSGEAPSPAWALFAEGRSTASLLLWTSYLFTQFIVYLINNWLPTLMVAKGFTPPQAGLISAIENFGAAVGCVILAAIADRNRTRGVILVSYVAIALGLAALGAAHGFAPVTAAAVVVGFFAIGGQLVLYAMAPRYYPTLARATGVGAAVSVGRVGGITGPLAAGKLMALGVAPAGVLLAATPAAALAGVAALLLLILKPPGGLQD
ncbi:MAG: 3-(3-hydroxy-phenyl)propionate transporter MhpT [Proteobacteria bacterium]|nr:3-(3-hydroxy-phenyl)propionate transporter MhpT [Pseudomonadota bacterium]